MPGFKRTGLKGSQLCILGEAEVERIHDGAVQILTRTGLAIHDDNVLALLDDAGCRVSREERRAWFPAGVVQDALAVAPARVTLYDRLGREAMALGSGPLHVRTSSGATGILDLDTGQRRAPTCRDAADAACLADALPGIHGVSAMAVQPADVPALAADLYSLRLALANTVKPLGYVCLNERLIESVLAMAAVVVGGEETLRQRPILTALAESTSPLQLVASQMAVLRAFASRGLPLTLHAHPMAGFTAPVTLPGELVVTHAEVLGLVTIAQLVRPGTPVVYGMSSSVPDMRTGTNLSGAGEIGLLGAAVAQLARRCKLPCVISSGTDAHEPGPQSILERLITLLPPALAGVDLINLTTLDTKMTFSLEQLALDAALLSTVERLLRGLTVDDASLALDLIDRAGPGGAFVTAPHTLRHFREALLIPDLIAHEPREAWEEAGRPGLGVRAREQVRRLLVEHRAPSLAGDIIDHLDGILEAAGLRAVSSEQGGSFL
jgi:trimethylamine--corrinoid protein Co-methyltransferase